MGFLLLTPVYSSKVLLIAGNAAVATFVAIKLSGSTLLIDTVKAGIKVVKEGNIIKFLNSFDFEIARIVDGVMTFKYTGFGSDLIANVNKTTTLIGKWKNQLENIWNTGLVKHGQNTGGFNVLGKLPPNWDDLTVAQKWANNKTWLDRAIARGDVIRVTANPLDINYVFHIVSGIDPTKFVNINTLKNYLLNLDSQKVEQLGYFGREIRHLFQNEYNFNTITNTFVR